MAASPRLSMLAARPEHIGSVSSGCCGAALRRVTSAVDTTADETSRREIRPSIREIPARLRARPARALSDHHTTDRPDQPGRGHPPNTEVIGVRVYGRTQAPPAATCMDDTALIAAATSAQVDGGGSVVSATFRFAVLVVAEGAARDP